MRTSLTSGSICQGLAVIGAGAAVMLPDQRWIGGIIILIGIMTLVFDIRIERGHIEVGGTKFFAKRLRHMLGHLLMILGGVLFALGAIYQFWPRDNSGPIAWDFDKPNQYFLGMSGSSDNVVVAALNASTAVEMAARKGIRLNRGSVASNLSRMSKDKAIVYDGDKYRLPEFTKFRILPPPSASGTWGKE